MKGFFAGLKTRMCLLVQLLDWNDILQIDLNII